MRSRRRQTSEGPARSTRCSALLLLLALSLVIVGGLTPAVAQSPGTLQPQGQNVRPASSFQKQVGGPLGGPIKKINKAAPLLLEGDEIIYDTKGNRVIARGNVQIYYDDYILTADQVSYDQTSNTLTAEGNAQLKEPNGNIVRADRLITTDDFRDAFVQSLSAVGKDDSRIVARNAVRRDGNVTEFQQGKFTPCKNDPGKPPLWCVSGERIIHDQQAGTISYQDATFEIFGYPVLYMPYFAHADATVKRRTGFLVPEISSSTTLGLSVEIPYYIAIAPNADFLFHPRYLSQHGVLWQGDFRHKVALGDVRGEYTVKLAGIDQDGATLPDTTSPDKRSRLDGWRGSMQTKGDFSLASWWRFGWDITLESDDTFRRFYKLDNILQTDRINTVYFEGLSERNFFGVRFYHFGGLLLEDKPASESVVHPVIDYRYIVGQPVLGGELSFNANALSLSRSDGTDLQRASFDANWRRRFVDPLGQTWTPFVNARADVTHFTNGFDPNTGVTIPEDTITRAIGAVGFTYSYPFVKHTAGGAHVIEPIVQAVARTGHIEQRRVPNEDAKSLVWDDTTVFEIDKFSGYDRVETGTRANAGLQYTFQANTGGFARIFAAQSFHLAGHNPYVDPGVAPLSIQNGVPTQLVSNFSPTSGLETARSDYVLGTYLAPNSNLRFVGQARFDENDLSLHRATAFGGFNYGPVALSGQYTYMASDPLRGLAHDEQEALVAAGLRLTDNWSLLGMARYDIDARQFLQQQIGIKYTDECFVLTATYTDNHINNPSLDVKQDRTIMLRFEMKYLGEFRYKTDALDHVFAPNAAPVK